MAEAAEIRVLLVTAPPERAVDLVRTLVEERLVACGNVVPGVRSIYVWQGALCDDTEALIVLETAATVVDAALARLRALHPYECPKLLVLDPAAVDDDYLAWVLRSTSPRGGDVDP